MTKEEAEEAVTLLMREQFHLACLDALRDALRAAAHGLRRHENPGPMYAKIPGVAVQVALAPDADFGDDCWPNPAVPPPEWLSDVADLLNAIADRGFQP